jgi:hypothetical protein
MYNTLRKIHLYAGLIVLVFLLMYFVSGFVIVHRPLLDGKDNAIETTTRKLSLADYRGEETPEALSAWAGERLNLHGKLTIPAGASADRPRVRFSLSRPGTTHQFELSKGADTLTITTRSENLAGVLSQLHRVHGYGGGWMRNLFVLFNDLASASCVVFAFTGVYLWWKTARRKTLGFCCLGVSCAYGVGMILYLMMAR